jgi:hypothetical protein
MRRAAVAILTVAALGAATGGAAAGPADEPHNCAGTTVSGGAGPGFGSVVSSAAHLQAVDNFGLANCGAPPRNNP